MRKYFEDYVIGEKIITPGRTVTEADVSILMGIARYNEPLMIDEEYARTTRFGTRIIPGRIVLAIAGGLLTLAHVFDDETTICGLGIKDVKFLNPLKAGDTIRLEVEFVRKEETSKPNMGILTHREVCKNQRGEVVFEAEESHLVLKRPKEPK